MANDNKQLNVGDVVQLPSGGPLMTVQVKHFAVGADTGSVSCVWFYEGHLCTGTFESQTLLPKPQ